jgi:hypothetical protein
MKIEKLTREQTAQIAVYRERYRQQAINTTPADRPRAEAAAQRLAEIAGLKNCGVHWVASPAEGRMVYGKISPEVSLRASRWNSLSASLSASLSDSLSDSIWNSLSASLSDSLCFYSFTVEQLKIDIDDKNRELLVLHNEIAASCFAAWLVPGKIIMCERPKTEMLKIIHKTKKRGSVIRMINVDSGLDILKKLYKKRLEARAFSKTGICVGEVTHNWPNPGWSWWYAD